MSASAIAAMIGMLQKVVKVGNAGLGIAGTLALAAPFLLQKNEVLLIPYPLIGVVVLIFAIWAEVARRTPTN